jgi:transcription elongation factor Elf1
MDVTCPKCNKNMVADIRLKGIERLAFECLHCHFDFYIELKAVSKGWKKQE